jgi:hypothetical protein
MVWPTGTYRAGVTGMGKELRPPGRDITAQMTGSGTGGFQPPVLETSSGGGQ